MSRNYVEGSYYESDSGLIGYVEADPSGMQYHVMRGRKWHDMAKYPDQIDKLAKRVIGELSDEFDGNHERALIAAVSLAIEQPPLKVEPLLVYIDAARNETAFLHALDDVRAENAGWENHLAAEYDAADSV